MSKSTASHPIRLESSTLKMFLDNAPILSDDQISPPHKLDTKKDTYFWLESCDVSHECGYPAVPLQLKQKNIALPYCKWTRNHQPYFSRRAKYKEPNFKYVTPLREFTLC
jgi:hypothetical protein